MAIETCSKTDPSVLNTKVIELSTQILPTQEPSLYNRYKSGESIGTISASEKLSIKDVQKAVKNEWMQILEKRIAVYLPLISLESEAESKFIQTKNAHKVIISQIENCVNTSDKPRSIKIEQDELAFLYKTPLLTREQEFICFRYLNYLRSEIDKKWNTLNKSYRKLEDFHNLENIINKADEIRNKILLSNQRLIVSNMKKNLNVNYTVFDALSDMQEVLIRAILKFDYSKGLKFSTFATSCIRNGAIRSYYQNNKYNSRFPQSSDDIFLEQSIECEAHKHLLNKIDLNVNKTLLARISNLLSERDLSILKMRHGIEPYDRGHKLKEIASKFGITRERVRQIESRVINKIIDSIDFITLESSIG
jgi:RNA polymerase primary sigma factor